MSKEKRAGIFRQVFSYTWSDPWFESCEIDAKLLFLYLVTNGHSSLAGIYEISKRVMSFETGIPIERVTEILKEFDVDGRVLYDEVEPIVWVVNMRKYQVNASPKVLTRAENDVLLIPNCRVKELYIQYYYGTDAYIEPPPQPKVKQIFSPLVEENKSVDFAEAIGVYANVTGNMAFPYQSMDADIYRIGKLISLHGDKTAEFLKPYWKEWIGRKYSRTNTAWLDWAIAGEIPRRKGNGNDTRTAAEKYKVPDEYENDIDDSEEDDTGEDSRWGLFVQQYVPDRRWKNLLEYGGEVDGKVIINVPETALEEAHAIFGKTLSRYYMGKAYMKGIPA